MASCKCVRFQRGEENKRGEGKASSFTGVTVFVHFRSSANTEKVDINGLFIDIIHFPGGPTTKGICERGNLYLFSQSASLPLPGAENGRRGSCEQETEAAAERGW